MNYNPIFFITSATLSGGNIILTVTGAPTISAKGVARFLFAPNVAVPSGTTGTEGVSLSIGGTQYQLLDKFAMPLTLSEIPAVSSVISGTTVSFFATRRAIVCGIGSDGAETPTYSFISWNLPLPSEFIIPLR